MKAITMDIGKGIKSIRSLSLQSVIVYLATLAITLSIFSITPRVIAQSTKCEDGKPLSFNVDADIAGAYTVWSRVQVKDTGGSSSSMHLGLGNSCIESSLGSTSNEWVWTKASSKLNLNKNSQTLNAYIPNGETWIDKIIFTLDDNCAPTGNGENCKLEKIEATLVGVEPDSPINTELNIFAEINGMSSSGSVTFILDGKTISSNISASSGVFCAGEAIDGECSPWDSSDLTEGEHSLIVSIKDTGRSLSLSRNFVVDKSIGLANNDTDSSSSDDKSNNATNTDSEPDTSTQLDTGNDKPTSTITYTTGNDAYPASSDAQQSQSSGSKDPLKPEDQITFGAGEDTSTSSGSSNTSDGSTDNTNLTTSSDDSKNLDNKAVADPIPSSNDGNTEVTTNAGGDTELTSTTKITPVIVIDTSSSIENNLEGEVKLTVPTTAISSAGDVITYTIDGEEVATATGDSPEALLDTSTLANRSHAIGATVLNSNGERTSVEVPVIVNNSPFTAFKRAITSTVARTIIVVILLGTALSIMVIKGKKYILNKQITTARIINPQPSSSSMSFASPVQLNSGVYAGAMVIALVGFSGIVIAAPDLYRPSPAYSGNATIIVEAETYSQASHLKATTGDVSYVKIIEQVTTTANDDSNDNQPTNDNNQANTQVPVVVTPAGSNTVENVISDIWGKPGNTQTGTGGVFSPWAKNDAHPEIPSGYDFYDGARASAWNDVNDIPWVQPWCTAYRDERGVGESNWRLQIRNYKYAELKDGNWKTLYAQSDRTWGGAYFNKVVKNSIPGNFQFRSDGNGAQSVDWNDAAAGLHPWAPRRVHTEYGSARFATAEMRLIPNTDPNVDLSKVKVLGICTWDQYTAEDCYVGKAGCSVSDGLYPRHKYITSEWQHFNAITVPIKGATDRPSFTFDEAAQAIRNIKPPIE